MARHRPTRIPTPHVRPRGAPMLVMGSCIVEIDRIVIREVQYQLEVNRCRNEEIRAGRPRIDRIVIREVQYQFEDNRCINEEIIVKGHFGWAWPKWAWPMWAGPPRLVMGPFIAEIDCIVIREVQYQFVVNRYRIEEIIVKGNFGRAWPMWAGCPRIDRIVIRVVQYQFEDNRCRNEEIIFTGSCAYSVGEESGQDGRTDGRTEDGDNHNIPTFSPKSVGSTIHTAKFTS
ncbi:hypothetical protein DPMN_140622 [Dreissena polymorpha]|uniref:Uncharacterized protein n=1 Tax=Dreissena polymorpha TaxID=45954 RepID=A0A9D4G824_DREPO|nr:hypothetical protein DPMN_140622 [Dreissena polymorpha]